MWDKRPRGAVLAGLGSTGVVCDGIRRLNGTTAAQGAAAVAAGQGRPS